LILAITGLDTVRAVFLFLIVVIMGERTFYALKPTKETLRNKIAA
jgi:hypothetical protein